MSPRRARRPPRRGGERGIVPGSRMPVPGNEVIARGDEVPGPDAHLLGHRDDSIVPGRSAFGRGDEVAEGRRRLPSCSRQWIIRSRNVAPRGWKIVCRDDSRAPGIVARPGKIRTQRGRRLLFRTRCGGFHRRREHDELERREWKSIAVAHRTARTRQMSSERIASVTNRPRSANQ